MKKVTLLVILMLPSIMLFAETLPVQYQGEWKCIWFTGETLSDKIPGDARLNKTVTSNNVNTSDGLSTHFEVVRSKTSEGVPYISIVFNDEEETEWRIAEVDDTLIGIGVFKRKKLIGRAAYRIVK